MKVLFLCTGNTCRSVMSEAIFNKLNNKDNLSEAYSAGISIVEGSTASENAVVLLKKYMNVDIKDRKAIQMNEVLLEQSDLILTMTEGIKELLKMYYPNNESEIFTLKEYAGGSGDIMDPFGCGIDVYYKTFLELKENINIILDKIKEDKSIV